MTVGEAGPREVFDLACGMTVGVPSRKLLYRRQARADFMAKELLQAIPDYHYSTHDDHNPDDPFDGRKKFYGNRYTGRLCDLGTSPVSSDDTTATGGAHVDIQTAGRGLRSRSESDDRHSSTARPGLRVPPALLIQIAEARRSELAAPPNSV